MDTNSKNEREFIREEIKKKPWNRKSLLKKAVTSIVCGFLFAVSALLIFYFALPALQNRVNPTGESVKGETESERKTESEKKTDSEKRTESEGETESEEETESEGETETESESAGTELEQNSETENKTEPGSSEPEEPLSPEERQKQLLEQYQDMKRQLYSVGTKENKAIVTVTGVINNTDWFNKSYEDEGQESGIIIGENINEYLIVTERKVIQDAARIYVTFVDDSIASAELKKSDNNTGIAILSVAKKEVSPMTVERIALARMGNSYSIWDGTIVIALGSPLGTNYSVLAGSVTSKNHTISLYDYNYPIFTTDIVSSKSGNGVLINLKGEVIALVRQDHNQSREENTLTAVPVDDIKPIVDMLLLGKDIPYLGMTITTVTDKIANQYAIPRGVYVKNVVMDSPAMLAGVQNGDVITGLNGTIVVTSESYSRELLKTEIGQKIPIEVQRLDAGEYTKVTYEVQVGICP